MSQAKPSIGVLFTDAAKWFKDYPFKKEDNRLCYSIFAERAEKNGVKIFFAYYKEYRKSGFLRRAWEFDKGCWKKVSNRDIDLVYSRFNAAEFKKNRKVSDVEKLKQAMAEDVSLINHPHLEEFCWDKRIVAEVFPEYCPKTFLVNTLSGLKTVLPKIKSNMIVLKPRYGTLGKAVKIIPKDKLPSKILRNTIVQEFIDSSKGIKGITNKIHDLRIIVANGKVDHCHVRTPKKGMLAANMALGGKKSFVRKELLSKSAKNIVSQVDKVLSNYYPRLYSIDLIFNRYNRPYIVECNSSPIIVRYAAGKYKRLSFYDTMFKTMLSGVKLKVESR
jgi:glutathione synthase/RimK-type ligase-like ATP-grasp enzyme